jgi:hypothetical protein
VPAFWLMVGRSDRGDVTAARTFQAVLGRWRAGPPLVLVPHTAHTFAAWIPALPKLLTWLTARIEVPHGSGTRFGPRTGGRPRIGTRPFGPALNH